jgi:hypothetical protein
MALSKRETSWVVLGVSALVTASYVWPGLEHQFLGLAAILASVTGIKLPEGTTKK